MNREEMIREAQVMQQEKAVENKKADKKAGKKFIVLIIISAVIGFCWGYFGISGKDSILEMTDILLHALSYVTPYANFVLATVTLVLCMRWQCEARKLLAKWDGEDEELIDRVETKINYGLIATSVALILDFFFFGLGFYSANYTDDKMLVSFRWIATIIGLIYSMVVITIYQKNFVNLTKEINPEKNGSVYDLKFQKVWVESCDESELHAIYKSSYAAYKTTTMVCLILMAVTVLGSLMWDMGIMPMAVVTIIWLTMTIQYSVECVRISKNSK